VAVPKVGFVSLGCPKALVDSERILTQLRAEGYVTAPDYAGADLVIVNTCGFIDAAVEESLGAIGEALAENGKVVVTGCRGVKADLVRGTHPSVLAITGPHDTAGVMRAVHAHLPKPHDPYTDLVPPQGVKLTPRHYAYLKIAEGCNHRCTFCIIPSMRGDLVSRPIGEVMQEAENLVKGGVRELLVISQDTSAYGVDVKYRTGFWNGKPLMAEGKILPYLDIPFQHASARILKLMKRPAHAERVLESLNRWRKTCPDIALRSTFIVGFPGETEADFEELLTFLKEARLDRVGCFAYSPVDGARANALPDPVPDEVKEARRRRFMQLQAKISRDKLKAKVGRTLKVLVDGPGVGRSAAEAPEIDGGVRFRGGKAGEFVDVRVERSDAHDLFGRLA
jgi:ribosomal protein S12 methylthiotransferase